MSHHDVDVFFTVDNSVVTRPDCESARILVGDTLTFHCTHGKLEIQWQDNPFNQSITHSGKPVEVVSAGPFRGTCKLTRPDGTPLNWKGGGLEGKSQTGDDNANSHPTN